MARAHNGGWVADGVDESGKRKRIQFRTQELAEQYEQDRLSHSAQHSIGHLFPKWADELWLGTKNERDAIGRARLVIKALGKDTHIRAINRATIKKLATDRLNAGNTQATVNKYLSCLSKLLQHAVEEEVLEEAPHIKLKQDPDSRRFRVLSEEEEDRLLAAFEDEHIRRFVSFLLYTGCRYSETKRLEWRDFSHNARTIQVWKSKTGKPRPVPLTDEAYAALEWTRRQGWERPWSGIVYRTFMLRWHKAREAAGLDEEVIPYACRHTCATRLALGGMDVFRLMKWMGHANIATTERYVQLNAKNLEQGVSILSRGKLKAV